MGVPLRYLNVGGGLGVDYDGSRTTFASSMNYTIHEYAEDVVYTTKDICSQEQVPMPDLLSESGRAVVAKGVRNSVGMDINPKDKTVWFTDNQTDGMGDDTPPGEQWRRVLDIERGEFPDVERLFLVVGFALGRIGGGEAGAEASEESAGTSVGEALKS